MQLEKLQINLRPRPPRQALELGYTLLRLAAPRVFYLYWALWLPCALALFGLSLYKPAYLPWFMLTGWLIQPWFERAVVYLLAHQVFGEEVSVAQALRAFPSQLRGGALNMLWLRRSQRALFHAVWQLENQRGAACRKRRQVLGQDGAGAAIFWFSFMCFISVTLMQFGVLAVLSVFGSNTMEGVNPFAILSNFSNRPESAYTITLASLSYFLPLGLITPVHAAGGFALYLNRRATLEAWDLEIALRQMPAAPAQRGAPALFLLCALALGLSAFSPQAVQAQEKIENQAQCEEQLRKDGDARSIWDNVGKLTDDTTPDPKDALNPRQQEIRRQTLELLNDPSVRKLKCEKSWRDRITKAAPKKKKERETPDWDFSMLGTLFKILALAAGIGAVAWLLWMYRDQIRSLLPQPKAAMATEIGGLDIRPDSLPPDVPREAWALWSAGKRREALALLYRATISRLVEQNRLQLARGSTEGDCLRAAQQAQKNGLLPPTRLQLTQDCTAIWRDAAWGDLWPQDAHVQSLCEQWRTEFSLTGART